MRTLSIRQPWAWLITRPDLTDPEARASALLAGLIKTIENRDWPTSYRGPILIHASLSLTKKYHLELQEDLMEELNIVLPAYEDLERGGVVGRARIVGCITSSGSPWWNGPYGFVLADAQPLPFVPWKGQQGFFDVPERALLASA